MYIYSQELDSKKRPMKLKMILNLLQALSAVVAVWPTLSYGWLVSLLSAGSLTLFANSAIVLMHHLLHTSNVIVFFLAISILLSVLYYIGPLTISGCKDHANFAYQPYTEAPHLLMKQRWVPFTRVMFDHHRFVDAPHTISTESVIM